MPIEINNLRESYYNVYKKSYDNHIDMKTYLKIVGGFILFLTKKILQGNDIKLGPGDSLGTIGIRGRKPTVLLNEDGHIKGAIPNWKATKELWEKDIKARESKLIVRYYNEHSNGVRYKLMWFKFDMRLKHKQFYSLQACRPFKRAISKHIQNGAEYLVISDKEPKN